MKRIFIIFSLTILFFSSFSIYRTDKASAVGEGAVLKIAVGSAGERALWSMAEKAGIKVASKATRAKATRRWNARIAERLYELEDQKKWAEYERVKTLQNQLASLETKSLAPKNDNVGSMLINGVLFITGAGLLVDLVDEINRSSEFNEIKDGLGDIKENKWWSAGTATGYGNIRLYQNGGKWLFGPMYDLNKSWIVGSDFRITDSVSDHGDGNIFIYSNYWSGGKGFLKAQAGGSTDISHATSWVPNEFPTEVPALPWLPGTGTITFNPDVDPNPYPYEVPDTFPIDVPLKEPTKDYDPVNEPIPDLIPRKVPDGGTVKDPEFEEVPIGGIEPVPIPGGVKPPVIPETPPKEPEDPTKPPGGEVPPGGKPGTFWMLLAFIDLLRAILWYIMRFVTFIVTIPAIPSLPFDNPAFHWVRTSKFLGIYPYAIVMNLATLGLSLSVYKIVRRFI